MLILVAERVVERSPVSLAGCQLVINIAVWEPMVKVTGIPQSLKRDVIELFFESSKRSGGGDIKDLTICREHNFVVITYQEPEGKKYILCIK